MKTWPSLLLDFAPLASHLHPYRPWWSLGSPRRRDGLSANNINEMAYIDRSLPLPHPGFRVGQIWAKPQVILDYGEIGALHVLTLFGASFSSEGDAPRWTFSILQDGLPLRNTIGHLGTHYAEISLYSKEDLHHLLQDSYLLLDPLCPGVAPWAPPEKSDSVDK